MKRNIYLKKVFAAVLTAAVLMTDQALAYAAEPAGDLSVQRVSEEKDTTPAVQSVWNPKFMEEVSNEEEERLFFSQPVIGRENDEGYVYRDSYGAQLTDPVAVRLYDSLTSMSEEKESDRRISLGTFLTEDETLAGDRYEDFQALWQTAAQNAFDAYLYDCAEAGSLDRENCRMTVYYAGQEQENGQFVWSASAEWELNTREDDPAQAPWTDVSDFFGDSEEAPEDSAEQTDRYQKLRVIFEKIQKFRLMIQENEEEKEIPPDLYARMFKALCLQNGTECVLVPGITKEGLCVWNAVYMEDENWYAVDILHNLFLLGADTESEDGFAQSHVAYGDFSDSQKGIFVLPGISENDYILPDMPETAGEEEHSLPASDDGIEDYVGSDPDDADREDTVLAPDDTVSDPDSNETEDPGADNTESDPPKNDTLLEIPENEKSAEDSLEGIITVSAIKDQTYTGKEIKPKITVKDALTKKTLKVNTHYTVSYENNINAKTAADETIREGTAPCAIIRSIREEDYGKELSVYFTILPRAITKASAKVLNASKLYYSGEEYTPDLQLVYNKTALTRNTEEIPGDYTVTYTNNTAVGTASAIVTGTEGGNFTGTRTLKFKIQKRPMKTMDIRLMADSVDLSEEPVQWEENFALPNVTVAYPETEHVSTACIPDQDYTVTYPKKLKAGKNTVTIKGKGNYTGSVKKTFTIIKKDIASVQVSCPYIWKYTGKNLPVRPSSVVFAADGAQEALSLKWKTDYTVKYRSSAGKTSSTVKSAGNYQMILTGKGNYQGTCIVDFCVIKDGSAADDPNNSDITLPTGGEKFTLTECRISSCEKENHRIRIVLTANRSKTLEHLKDTFYIAMLDSAEPRILKASEGVVDVQIREDVFSIEAEFLSDDALGTEVMSRYGIAVEVEKGKYQLLSDGAFLRNPEAVSSARNDEYWGYYEENDRISSKKGIQGTDFADTDDLKVQHVLLNIDLADLIGTTEGGGYRAYTYKGNTYYFRDLWGNEIYNLNGWGNELWYGPHKRNVTAVFLLSWKEELSYLIHPSARKKGAAPYYTLNMQEQKARDTFEALFCWLGETYAQNDKYRIENWTLGNEVNSCKAWNYSGGMSLKDCVENYAKAFQLLHQGVRRSASSPRLFISLDHCWTASVAGHSGKAFLDEFADYMNRTAPDMQWNVNYHAYSQPLTRSKFWSDFSNTTDAVTTKYISMKNIQVLTDYLSALETKYNKPDRSVRVILGEHGYSARLGNTGEEEAQAAALGYGYYIAMFNDRIDAYMIRAYLDDPDETKGGLYLGLTGRGENGEQKRKESYGIYKYIDTEQSLARMDKYLSLIGISDWSQTIKNFRPSDLVADPGF